MKSWASSTLLGASRRQVAVRAGLAMVLLTGLLWFLPARRAGEEGGHHGHPPDLDPFERAGVTELAAGQRGPAFRLERFEGGWAGLDTWRDRLVVLNFWATWCTPCTVEMPTLEALWRAYRDRGLVVVGVTVDRGAPRSVIGPYLRSLGLTFPVLLDPEMETASRWRVTGLPTTFLIRPGGEVVGMAQGPREWNSAEMRALLDTLLPAAHAHPGGESAGG
jgi:peroxiredoxin